MALGVDDMQKRLRTELSTGSRLAHTAVGMAGLGMAVMVSSLLATEPSVPVRTRVAFVVIALGGLAWAGFAAWVLTRKRVLLAGHRVAASSLAAALSLLFLAGAITWREQTGALAIACNTLFLAISIAWLVRSRRRFADLRARYEALTH